MRSRGLLYSVGLGVLALALGTTNAYAAAPVPVSIFVNDAELDTYDQEVKTDMPAYILNGRTLMPLKRTFELFGLQVKWDSKAQSVEALTDTGKTIWLQIGNKNAKVSGQTVALDVPARVINNRTYVPLAFIAKAVGHEAIWDGTNKLVKIYTDGSEQLNLAAIPKTYSNQPLRVNNSIFFDGTGGRTIAVSKTELSFSDAVNLVSEMLYIQAGDFSMGQNDPNYKIAVYEDQFMGLSRSNLVVEKSGAVLILEIRGMSEQEAVDLTKKLIK